MNYTLPKLDFQYDALEPYMDEATVKIHHTKHHQKYVDNFNEAIKNAELFDSTPEKIFPSISQVPDAVAKNAGQAFNHSMFWKSLSPNAKKGPGEDLEKAIVRDFESLNLFKDLFMSEAAATFGSGWAWLIDTGNKLEIVSTSNHINPLMDIADEQGKPLFCIDVWEHAYYLKYQNKRPDYLEAIWNILNWDEIEKQYSN